MNIWKFCARSRRVAATVLGLLLFAVGTPAAVPDLKPGDGPEAFDQVAFWTMHRLSAGEYGIVDEAIGKYGDPKLRALDGRAMLTGIDIAIDRFATRHALNPETLPEIQELRKQSPNSIALALIEVSIWRAAAWSARGPGYSSSVSDEGWKLFKERLQKADAVLTSCRPFASKSALWYTIYLDNALELGKPASDRDDVFREGVARFPDYHPLYFAYLRAHLRQWSGSEQQPFAVVEAITQGGKTDENAILYGRMMWFIQQNTRFRNRKGVLANGARWPVMKRGFMLIHERFPASLWNASNFLSFACTANDREAYPVWRAAVGADGEKHSGDADYDIATCDHKFRPMSETQWRYERLVETIHDPMAEMIRACGDGDNPKVLTSFREYMARRLLMDKMEKTQKPEEPWEQVTSLAMLQEVDPANATAACKAMGFGSLK